MNLDEIFNNSFEKKMLDENIVNTKVNECRNLIIQKFGDIKFLEEGHKYFIGEDEYIPVSNIIKKYEPEVDWIRRQLTMQGNGIRRRRMFRKSGNSII